MNDSIIKSKHHVSPPVEETKTYELIVSIIDQMSFEEKTDCYFELEKLEGIRNKSYDNGSTPDILKVIKIIDGNRPKPKKLLITAIKKYIYNSVMDSIND